MSNGRGKHKSRNARRAHKVSKGIHGATHHPLSPVEKVLLGKGLFESFRPLGWTYNHREER